MSSETCRGLEAPCLKPGSVAPLFVWFDLNCGTWGEMFQRLRRGRKVRPLSLRRPAPAESLAARCRCDYTRWPMRSAKPNVTPARAMGARTFVTPVAFIQAAMLNRGSGSGSEGWKTRAAKFFAKWTIWSPEPLAISRMTPVISRASRRKSRMKSRLRSVAGAY
jgi:hypothetical protein